MFDGLQILSNPTKHDQTHTNTIKQHQTRRPNGKMFGHQTMFDGVWSPNIYRLSRPLDTLLGAVWSCLIKIEGHFLFWRLMGEWNVCSFGQPRIKHVWCGHVYHTFSAVWSVFDQACLTVWPLTSALAWFVTKQCLMVFGRQKFPVSPGEIPSPSFGKQNGIRVAWMESLVSLTTFFHTSWLITSISLHFFSYLLNISFAFCSAFCNIRSHSSRGGMLMQSVTTTKLKTF